MNISETIYSKLQAEFQPEKLEILDDSKDHEGHAGYQENGPSHVRIVISAKPFDGMSRIERQRAVFKVIDDEVKVIHAIGINFV